MRWIFAYGSLIWRPGFEYSSRRIGYVRGWRRRFWQASSDHRGTPSAPGRVVTLVSDPASHCWGVVFEVDPADWASVLEDLDVRESGGYQRTEVSVYFGAEHNVEALTYIAHPDNPNYLGPTENEVLAEQIVRAKGPSGDNVEYLFKLATELRTLQIEDDDISALEARVRSMI